MKRSIKRIIKFILLFGIIGCIWFLLIPRTYNVPQLETSNQTKFWKLSTGSNIGYTLIPATTTIQKMPIIYLHGGPGGCISKKKIESCLPFSKVGHPIYLYDQIGSGHSDRLEQIAAYTVERHVADLAAIVKQLDVPKVILLGQSWGAILATLFVAQYPDAVEKIILTGPGPIPPINRNVVAQTAPDSFNFMAPIFSNQEGNQQSYNLRTKLIRSWAYAFERKFATDQEVDDFFTYLNQSLHRSTVCDTSFLQKISGGGGYYVHIMTFKSFQNVIDPRDQIKTVKTPVLILKGQCDNQKWGFAQEYLDLFQNSTLEVIPNAGHSITIEQPELYTQIIIDFLDTKESGIRNEK